MLVNHNAPIPNNAANFQKVHFESGTLKETKINICNYEMYEMELLDRSLMSL